MKSTHSNPARDLAWRAVILLIFLPSLLSKDVFDYIEGWYNPRRRHSALDYLSPMAYEKRELSRA